MFDFKYRVRVGLKIILKIFNQNVNFNKNISITFT